MKRPLVITGGRVIDPANGVDGEFDLYVEDGKISAVDKPGSFSSKRDVESVSAKGQLVIPGIVDIHCHLREPGEEWKATIETERRAAEVGGVTSICCMPNTNPVNDNLAVTSFIVQKAAERNGTRVYPIGSISKGMRSDALAPMLEMRKGGAVAFSDDGRPVTDANLMRRALEYSLQFDGVLTCHEEDMTLSGKHAMNEGLMSFRLGLKGWPEAAENVIISRDIELSRATGGRVHFCHVTTARGVELIRRAKEDGIPVSAEVTPHHFMLTDDAVHNFDTNTKMAPPLRRPNDVEALLQALEKGVIDCIATDHAPHEYDSKHREFDSASFGILGFQTTVPLTLQRVREKKLTLGRAIESLTIAPAKCFKLSGGTLSRSAAADITIIDPDRKVKHTPQYLASKSKNTPWLNAELTGHTVKTFVGGEMVFDLDSYLEGLPR